MGLTVHRVVSSCPLGKGSMQISASVLDRAMYLVSSCCHATGQGNVFGEQLLSHHCRNSLCR